MQQEIILKLRNGESIKTFGKTRSVGGKKMFTKYQLNRKEKFICWQRFESFNAHDWIEQNSYLRLKDVMGCIERNIALNTN